MTSCVPAKSKTVVEKKVEGEEVSEEETGKREERAETREVHLEREILHNHIAFQVKNTFSKKILKLLKRSETHRHKEVAAMERPRRESKRRKIDTNTISSINTKDVQEVSLFFFKKTISRTTLKR